MREQLDSVRAVVLGIVAQYPEGVHGYRIREEYERLLGKNLWPLKLSDVYRALEKLEERGCLERVPPKPGTNRKEVRITELGRSDLTDFIPRESTEAWQPRFDLAVKLMLASSPDDFRALLRTLDTEHNALMQRLHEIGVLRRKLGRRPMNLDQRSLLQLVFDGCEILSNAALDWLEILRNTLRERFATVS